MISPNLNITNFEEKMERVKDYFNTLVKVKPEQSAQVLNGNQKNGSGVYIFSEIMNDTERFLYVGQAESVFARLAEHCAIKNHQKANFAYMLTVKSTGLKPIPYSPNSTKESMFRDDRFVTEFNKIIARIKLMNYRWIEVNDKLEKNLLEIYAAVILETEFNDFA